MVKRHQPLFRFRPQKRWVKPRYAATSFMLLIRKRRVSLLRRLDFTPLCWLVDPVAPASRSSADT